MLSIYKIPMDCIGYLTVLDINVSTYYLMRNILGRFILEN